MSLGYAEKLSYIEDVGEVGMKEFFDPPLVLQEKVISTESPYYNREAILRDLRDQATQDSTCGRNVACWRKNNVAARNETTSYAIVTNVVSYAKLLKAHEAESTGGIGDLKSWTECIGTTIRRKRSKR